VPKDSEPEADVLGNTDTTPLSTDRKTTVVGDMKNWKMHLPSIERQEYSDSRAKKVHF
jgi:hypothetical protein